MDMYTLLSLKWITNKDLRHSTGNSAQCYVTAWMAGEFGMDMYTLLYLMRITNKDLPCGTESSSQYSVMAYTGKESLKKKKSGHMYTYELIHFAVHLRLRQHC